MQKNTHTKMTTQTLKNNCKETQNFHKETQQSQQTMKSLKMTTKIGSDHRVKIKRTEAKQPQRLNSHKQKQNDDKTQLKKTKDAQKYHKKMKNDYRCSKTTTKML